MAAKPIDMSKLRQVLRLYSQGKSKHFISDYIPLSRNTVKKYIKHFNELKTTFEELDKHSDLDLEQRFIKDKQIELSPKLKSLYGFFPYAEKEFSKLERQSLLILDDFGLQPLDNQSRLAFIEIIEYRHGKGSIIITSQLPVSGWYDIIGEKTIADAIMDRLVHKTYRIELGGGSMRRKKATLITEKKQ